MTDLEKAERQRTLQQMARIVDGFYHHAVKLNVHTFVEFAGFMKEYINMLQKMLDEGIDFIDNEIRAKPYQMAYVAEKLDCIFGASMGSPETASSFYAALTAKGWPMPADLERLSELRADG